MAGHQTNAKVTDKNGNEVVVQHNVTESPMLPVEHLERLHNFRPDLIDFYIEETKKESDYRRNRIKRVDWFMFMERMSGQIFALAIGICSILAGAYVVTNGHDWAGAAFVSSGIGGLAMAFAMGRNKQEQPTKPPAKKNGRQNKA